MRDSSEREDDGSIRDRWKAGCQGRVLKTYSAKKVSTSDEDRPMGSLGFSEASRDRIVPVGGEYLPTGFGSILSWSFHL